MALPAAIEYILSLERPGGGRLCYASVSQLLVPIFPPGVSITLTTSPFDTDFAFIGYASALGPVMVPEAFEAWGQQWGNRQYSGPLSSWFLQNTFDAFIVVTQSEPSVAQITNVSGLNQIYEGHAFFVSIATESDWDLIIEALARLGTSTKSETLAVETNRLLRVMTRQPQPPLEEG